MRLSHTLCALVLILVSTAPATAAVTPVNAVLGDFSFIEKYGVLPDATTDEVLRIQTHLAYVEQILRAADTSPLSAEQLAERKRLIDVLRKYRQAGEFPRHTEKQVRIPRFMDDRGVLCAVGFLISQSAGRAVAERINSRFEYAFIHEIDDPAVDAWARTSGFSPAELAMIQPSYDFPRPIRPRPIKPIPRDRFLPIDLTKSGKGDKVGGKRHGMWTFFHRANKLHSQGIFDGGIPTGLWAFWFENGSLKLEGRFDTGKKAGLWLEWSDRGVKTSERRFAKGLLHGLSVHFDDKGVQKTAQCFDKGRAIWTQQGKGKLKECRVKPLSQT